MPEYSRDEVVATLTSYYQFLTTMYLPESEVLYPPEGGWPNITQERFAFLEKTDTVIDLLRHLPYVRKDTEDEDEQIHIYEFTICQDFRGKDMDRAVKFKSKLRAGQPVPELAVLPPHVISLAKYPNDDGYFIFLDTERGTATMFGTPTAWRDHTPELSQSAPEDSDQAWRNDPTYTVPDLFGLLKQKFTDLEVVPVENHWRVNPGGQAQEAKDLFEKYGWPSSEYDKQSCMEEMEALVTQRDSWLH